MNKKTALTIVLALFGVVFAAPSAWASKFNEFNMPYGVTPMSHQIWDLHMGSFYTMCGIAFVVFGALIWTIIRHRRSRHPEAAQFHENIKFEVIWWTAPFIILIGLAIPGTMVLMHVENFHHADLKIKVTAYQWLWQYQYLDTAAKPTYGFYSRLAYASEKRMGLRAKTSVWSDPTYLEDVNHPLIVPTHEKILMLITSGDVIHSWWMPDFGGKQDAIPGFINQMWINVDKPGIYRGVCNQVCGAGHAYMPIVVVAVPKAQFEHWYKAEQSGKAKGPPTMKTFAKNGQWTAGDAGRIVASTETGNEH
ncbi:MAG: cytochrome c oxidase subunit II [Gammaproteobacteria bacterium]